MVIDPFIQEFPDRIRTLIDELSQDAATESIWLIGSRANSCSTATSDWDFLIFSNAEPVPVAERLPDTDLLRVGPSGRVLTDGGNEVEFRDFVWKPIDDCHARYIGKKFRPFEPGIGRDMSEPVFDRSEQLAILIHRIGK